MAISNSTFFEVRTAGNDTNGGGFVQGASGTDYSQQNSKNSGGTDGSTTDAVANGTTTITSATASFGTTIVGNIIYLQGGSGSLAAGWYQVTARTNVTTITVDRTVATGTGITMNIGGAILSPSVALGATSPGNTVFVKSGTYSLTTNTTKTAGGAFAASGGTTWMIGYNTTRSFGNTDTQPIIQTNASTVTQIQDSGLIFVNITFDGNTQTASKLSANAAALIYCTIKNFNTAAGSGLNLIACSITTNSASMVSGNSSAAVFCESFANTAVIFSTTAVCINCLSYSNTGASTDGFGAIMVGINCDSVSNGRDGFHGALNNRIILMNCHAESNTGWQYNPAGQDMSIINCSHDSSGSGGVNPANSPKFQKFSDITTSGGSVFVDPSNNNYALNALASRGAALRAAGYASFSALFPRGITKTLSDIGSVMQKNLSARWDMSGGMNG